jgi:hypothetical protein
MRHKGYVMALLAGSVVAGSALGATLAAASDHDDGETEAKGRNVNLTDLYVFREKDQNTSVTTDDLIFIMNCNPRSVAKQQYYWNTKARYDFRVTRVANNADTPTGKTDVMLRFEFAEPNTSAQQAITVTAMRDGTMLPSATATTSGGTILSTPIGATPVSNTVSLGGSNLTIFAGTREDPFFFDVEQYFKVRASAAAGALGTVPFRNPGVDFTAGYNVLAIVAKVPREFLQGTSSTTTFDVWETISVKS